METYYELFKTEIIKGIHIEENGLGKEPESLLELPKKGFVSGRWEYLIMAGLTWQGKRSTGKTGFGPSGVF